MLERVLNNILTILLSGLGLAFVVWLSSHFTMLGLANVSLAFLLGAFYSYVELLNVNNARSIFKTRWGIIYLLLNGTLSALALVLTFQEDFNIKFLGAKILVAGTSAIALLRVISIPIKVKGVENKVNSMIDIVLGKVQVEYYRERTTIDLPQLKKLMTGIDYRKAAENIPPLAALFQTLTSGEAEKLKIEVQEFLTLEEGKEMKHIVLGSILVKYFGMTTLTKIIDESREFISFNQGGTNQSDEEDDLDKLIKKYS